MKQYLLLITLSLLFVTCRKGDSVNMALVGLWSLVASLDSTRKAYPLIPFVPVVVEFRANGTTDPVSLNGQPQRNCCQPTRYIYQPLDCPANAVCIRLGTITYTDWVRCSGATCANRQTETVVGLTDTYLDLHYGKPAGTLRYQRIN